MERFSQQIARLLSMELGETILPEELGTPPEDSWGDFAYACFGMAKKKGQSPPALAQHLCKTLLDHPQAKSFTIQNQGPYLNFTVDPQLACQTLLTDILASPPDARDSTTYGSLPAQSRQKWVIEFSSPNVAKPLNIYHLRPTLLGAALDRIARYRGHQVVSINHLGDWGKQYGLLAIGLKDHQPLPSTMEALVGIYVQVNAELADRPELEALAKSAFLKLEQGDPEMVRLWKHCVLISMSHFQEQYKKLGIQFDHILGESFYQPQLQPLLESLKKQGLLIQSEGAWVIPVVDAHGKALPPCLLQKQDGATLYATRDLAAALYRYQQFHFDQMLYIVGAEQKLHFQQLFGVLNVLKKPWVKNCEHIPTGLYRFQDEKMSTRKGNYLTFESVFQQTQEKVAQLILKRFSDSQTSDQPAQLSTISEKIALGAIVFQDLHTDPIRDINFNLQAILDFEGETGPYLQYAHTRCLSLLNKASLREPFDSRWIPLLQNPLEIKLIKQLGRFPTALEKSLTFRKANTLTHSLIQTARAFQIFYHECPVLSASPDQRSARLILVDATRRILKKGMDLLGIPTPEQM